MERFYTEYPPLRSLKLDVPDPMLLPYSAVLSIKGPYRRWLWASALREETAAGLGDLLDKAFLIGDCDCDSGEGISPIEPCGELAPETL